MLVRQTLSGAVTHLESTEKSPETLREEVTSKAGTTEAALNTFTLNNVGTGLEKGIEAAFKRACEISKES